MFHGLKTYVIAFALVVLVCGVRVAQAHKSVVVIPMDSAETDIKGSDCPDKPASAIGGPVSLYNFCWYAGVAGKDCDQICSDVGGKNSVYSAESAWQDNCDKPGRDDVSTWFYYNGNPGNWTGPFATSNHRHLGYGSAGNVYVGKCTVSSTEIGAYPDANYNPGVHLMCPCFGFVLP